MRQAVAYCRVSTLDQAEKDISIPAQMKEIADYAANNDITIIDWFKDEGKSAFHDVGREDFEKAIKRVCQGDIEHLLVYDTTRFCRDRYVAVSYKKTLRSHGASVIAITRAYDPSTESGVIMEALDEALAQTDSMRNSKQTIKSMKQNAITRDPESGWCFKNGGRSPFGFRSISVVRGRDSRGRDIRKQLWEIDEREADIVKEIFNKRLGGWGYKAIARDLNVRGIRTRSGISWGHTHIREMCYRDRLLSYSGSGVWNKTTKHYHARPQNEWVITPNAHPQIIPQEWVERLALDNRRNEHPIPRVRDSRWLLTGLNSYGDRLFMCFCSDCEAYMVATQPSKSHLYYGCSRRVYQQSQCAFKHRIRKEKVEGEVAKWFQMAFGTREAVERWIQTVLSFLSEQKAGIGSQKALLLKAKTDLARKRENLLQAVEEGLPFAEVRERLGKIQSQLAEVESNQSLLESELPSFDIEDMVPLVGELLETVAQGGTRAKIIMGRFLNRVIYYPATGEVKVEPSFLVSEQGGVGSGT